MTPREHLARCLARRAQVAAELEQLEAAWVTSFAALQASREALEQAQEAASLAAESATERQTATWAGGIDTMVNTGQSAAATALHEAALQLTAVEAARAMLRGRLEALGRRGMADFTAAFTLPRGAEIFDFHDHAIQVAVRAVVREETAEWVPALADRVLQLQAELLDQAALLERLVALASLDGAMPEPSPAVAAARCLTTYPQTWCDADRQPFPLPACAALAANLQALAQDSTVPMIAV